MLIDVAKKIRTIKIFEKTQFTSLEDINFLHKILIFLSFFGFAFI